MKRDIIGLRALFEAMTALKMANEKFETVPGPDALKEVTEISDLVSWIRKTLAENLVDESPVMKLF